MLIDIKKSSSNEISSHLYNLVHYYAAVDFEVQKFKGDHAKPGSMLEKYRVALAKFKRLLDDSECIVIPLPWYATKRHINLQSERFYFYSLFY